MKKLFIFAPAYANYRFASAGEGPLRFLENLGTHTTGEMAEWSIAAVLKTVEGHTSGGSNPSFSAESLVNSMFTRLFIFRGIIRGIGKDVYKAVIEST